MLKELKMKIGIMSDSHDNLVYTDAAIGLFNAEKIELMFHGGDFCSPFVVKKLFYASCPIRAVFGNNDGDKDIIRKLFVNEEKAEIENYALVESIGDKKIIIQHGHIPYFLDALIKSQQYDVIITGHTHKPEISTEGKSLVINPGTTAGYLAMNSTVVILDIETMKASIKELETL
jgi:putative phosphoesterase